MLVRLQIALSEAFKGIVDLSIILSIAEIDYGLTAYTQWAALNVELFEQFHLYDRWCQLCYPKLPFRLTLHVECVGHSFCHEHEPVCIPSEIVFKVVSL